MAKFVIHGGKELQQKLDELPPKVARRICSKSMRAGAKVIQKEVKRRAPKQSGALRKSFKVRAGRRKRNQIRFIVSTAAKEFTGKQFYGSFLTFGWQTGQRSGRATTRRKHAYKAARRQVPPNPFIAESFEAKKAEATRAITAEMREGFRDLVRQHFNPSKPKPKTP